MELRNRVRHRFAANAMFTWECAQSSRVNRKGVTRDISLAGVFIFTSTSPPVGTAVQLEIFLAPLLRGPGSVRIKTEATVIRIEHSGGGEGFAVVGQGFSLLSGAAEET